jgi:AcrR family transcriptional regulator
MNMASAPLRQRGRPRQFDRDEALERAMLLFWERGYESTSVSDLTEAMGISTPSLYGAFGDKKQLFLEAVERYQAGTGGFAQAALRDEPTAESAMRRLLLDAVAAMTRRGRPRGCMVALSATNCAEDSRDVFEALSEQRKFAERAIKDRIAAGAAAGELAEDTDVDALAGFITALLHGLAIHARDGISRARLQKRVDQAMRMWPRRPRSRSRLRSG